MNTPAAPLPPIQPPAVENDTGIRIAATVVDLLVFVPVFFLMAALFGDFGKTDSASFEANLNDWGFIAYVLLILAYYFVMEGLRGQTIGKMVTGLYVMTDDGRHPAWSAILVRTLLRLVDWLPAFYLVGFISVAVTKRHQRLGDLAAKTIVAKKLG